MIPSMWRVELLHPLFVHFPIALLLVGAALRAVGGHFVRSRAETPVTDFVFTSSQLMNVIGVSFGWIAYYTGLLAEEEVNSNLCDPTITHLHGDYAFYAMIVFTIVVVADGFQWVSRWKDLFEPRINRALNSRPYNGLFALVTVLAAALMGYVGHLGASLTYQQAAGVYQPSPECTEFAEPPVPTAPQEQ